MPGRQSRPGIVAPGSVIFVNVCRINTGGHQRIALQVGGLRGVRLRYPHIANEHGLPVTYTYDYLTASVRFLNAQKLVI